jgi:hypothetical protein
MSVSDDDESVSGSDAPEMLIPTKMSVEELREELRARQLGMRAIGFYIWFWYVKKKVSNSLGQVLTHWPRSGLVGY